MTWRIAVVAVYLIVMMGVYLQLTAAINLALQSVDTAGTRTRRLAVDRMARAAGRFQIATGVVLVVLTGTSNLAGAVALIGAGGAFLLGARLRRRTGIAPWYAPEPAPTRR